MRKNYLGVPGCLKNRPKSLILHTLPVYNLINYNSVEISYSHLSLFSHVLHSLLKKYTFNNVSSISLQVLSVFHGFSFILPYFFSRLRVDRFSDTRSVST